MSSEISAFPAAEFAQRVEGVMGRLVARRQTEAAIAVVQGRLSDSFYADTHAIITRLRAELERERATAGRLRDALADIVDAVAVCCGDYGKGTYEVCQTSDFSEARAALAASREDGK